VCQNVQIVIGLSDKKNYKMKKYIFFILLIFTSFNLVRSQSTSFFDDVQSMKMSLCFKDFIIASRNFDLGRLRGVISSREVFLHNDSSMIVVVHLNSRSYGKRKVKDKINIVSPSESISSRKRLKKNEKTLKKFGADGGGFEKMEKKPASSFLSGYELVGGGLLFSNGGLLSLEVYQREGNGKKMSEKALINFASSFIRFND